MIHSAFGEFFKKRRQANGLTLRSFCIENSLDPGNISKLERGLLPPPASHNKLEQYASILGIENGSDDWYEFFDLAAACRGKIPFDFDEQLINKLPLVFRTLRGQKVPTDQLDKLVDRIKGS